MYLLRIVADNFDLTVKARIQSKDHSNQSIHWTQQYAIRDRLTPEPSANLNQPQCRLADLDLQKLLPDSNVQANFKRDCIILISRILTTNMPAFQFLKDTVIHHIPHPYSAEQSKKSEIVSEMFNFLNHPTFGKQTNKQAKTNLLKITKLTAVNCMF